MGMHHFDMKAFHAAVDEERRARSLSWVELAAEINKPFEHTTSIPISAGTLRDMPKKTSVTSAVVLQALRWLGRSPEGFLSGRVGPAGADKNYRWQAQPAYCASTHRPCIPRSRRNAVGAE